jgi:hypothetical protein
MIVMTATSIIIEVVQSVVVLRVQRRRQRVTTLNGDKVQREIEVVQAAQIAAKLKFKLKRDHVAVIGAVVVAVLAVEAVTVAVTVTVTATAAKLFAGHSRITTITAMAYH